MSHPTFHAVGGAGKGISGCIGALAWTKANRTWSRFEMQYSNPFAVSPHGHLSRRSTAFCITDY